MFDLRTPPLVGGVVGLNQLLAPIVLRLVLVRSGEAGKKTRAETHGH